MHIYTRSGDKGETGLATGQRVSKSSPIIQFVGLLDELNALIGNASAFLKEEDFDFKLEIDILEDIQKDLFVVGSIAVGANLKFNAPVEISNIEKTINDYEKILPKLTKFILPGGSVAASQIHLARTGVRNVERYAISLKSGSLMSFVPYLNRLSDLLFVMARYVNFKMKIREVIWNS